MTIYLSDRTGASIDSVLDKADTGNIGKNFNASGFSFADADDILASGFGKSNVNSPTASVTPILMVGGNDFGYQLGGRGALSFSSLEISSWGTWQELYHTANTGVLTFGDVEPDGSADAVNIRANTGLISIANDIVSAALNMAFINPNGQVGAITTSGTSTAFITSSDPRLKNFKELPSDLLIDTEFNNMFDCFRVFNWKSEPDGDLVWGFDAHQCIDNKTNIGSEGEGPRNLELGDVYETTPAVTENRVVMDAEGNPTNEIEEVVITKAIEHKVTPAGVDQSKAVPILLAKIEQLERRLTAAGL